MMVNKTISLQSYHNKTSPSLKEENQQVELRQRIKSHQMSIKRN